ncbi:hypothetical protein N8Z19_01540, partial [Saprospiraceae bacterium]|nr:hypothetical protein [Saprospiraceae bacterium]
FHKALYNSLGHFFTEISLAIINCNYSCEQLYAVCVFFSIPFCTMIKYLRNETLLIKHRDG